MLNTRTRTCWPARQPRVSVGIEIYHQVSSSSPLSTSRATHLSALHLRNRSDRRRDKMALCDPHELVKSVDRRRGDTERYARRNVHASLHIVLSA